VIEHIRAVEKQHFNLTLAYFWIQMVCLYFSSFFLFLFFLACAYEVPFVSSSSFSSSSSFVLLLSSPSSSSSLLLLFPLFWDSDNEAKHPQMHLHLSRAGVDVAAPLAEVAPDKVLGNFRFRNRVFSVVFGPF
jgi:hypothetical protein